MTHAELRTLASDIRTLARASASINPEFSGSMFRLASRIKRRAQWLDKAGPDAFYIQIFPNTNIPHLERTLIRNDFRLRDVILSHDICTATIAPL